MLFMAIYSYGPEKRAQVIQRRLEKGAMDPPGSKLLGEWSYAGGGKVEFLLVQDLCREPGLCDRGGDQRRRDR